MRRALGLVVGGLVLSAAEGATGVVALVTLGPARIALYLIACAVATALVTAYVGFLVRSGPGRRGGGDGRGDGPRPSDDGPPWWPEFEREFRRHVRERSRESTPV